MAKLPSLHMLDGKAVGPEEPQQALHALRHEEVLTALMLSNACLVHKLVRHCTWQVDVSPLQNPRVGTAEKTEKTMPLVVIKEKLMVGKEAVKWVLA